MFFYFVMAFLESLFTRNLFGDFFKWVSVFLYVLYCFFCSQLLSVEGICLAMEVKMPLVSHGLLKERCSFLDA